MRRMKRSTRPPVSTNRCSPVKNGWHREQMSTRIIALVECVEKVLPQAQCTVASTYSGWMSFFNGPARPRSFGSVDTDALPLAGRVFESNGTVNQSK